VVTRQHVQLAVREGTEATLVERLSAHQATPVQYRRSERPGGQRGNGVSVQWHTP
jgi:DNA-binding IclR family transcriptional regulator